MKNRVHCDNCQNFIPATFESDQLFSNIIKNARCRIGKRVMFRKPKSRMDEDFGYIRICDKFKKNMKANELRLGNIVRVNNLRYYPKLKDINTEVTGIRKGIKGFFLNLNHSCEHYIYDINQLMDFVEPVELTKELIYNFQFKKDFVINGFKLGYFEIKIINGVFWYDIVELKYAHQLQNLYFAITGNELILKL